MFNNNGSSFVTSQSIHGYVVLSGDVSVIGVRVNRYAQLTDDVRIPRFV